MDDIHHAEPLVDISAVVAGFPVNLLEELNRTVYWLTLISQEKERVIIFPHHINHRHVISLTKSDHE